jgi:hypothetical protein
VVAGIGVAILSLLAVKYLPRLRQPIANLL